VTAVISIIAETGNRLQAQSANPWYAMISQVTRMAQPSDRSTSATDISLALNSTCNPVKAGSTLGPTVITIVAMNPTVSACREAPAIPGAVRGSAAFVLVLCGISVAHSFRDPVSGVTPSSTALLSFTEISGPASGRQPLAGGAPRKMPDPPDKGILSFDWSIDGNQFAMTYGEEARDVVLISNFR
jgi:hypothetical protein